MKRFPTTDPFHTFGPQPKTRRVHDPGDTRTRSPHDVGRGDPFGGDDPGPLSDRWVQAPRPDDDRDDPPSGERVVGPAVVELHGMSEADEGARTRVPTDAEWFLRKPREVDWPAWVQGFRPDQLDACDRIIDAFERGVRVVMLDAPTGAGKTLIAEMVRRKLAVRSTYVCTGKQLQDQFMRDYGEGQTEGGYARVLKGRSNYPTLKMPSPEYTGDDCTGRDCKFCPSRNLCPYQVAKSRALGGVVSVLNTSYLLAEANTRGAFGEHLGGSIVDGRGTRMMRPKFVVVDEADELEGALMGYVECRVGARTLEELGLVAPVKAARLKTVKAWLETLVGALESDVARWEGLGDLDVAQGKRLRARQRLLDQVRAVELGEVNEETGKEEWGDWIREYEVKWDGRRREEVDTGNFVLKAVVVDKWGDGVLWRHADRWLLMSATIISGEEMAESLGLERAGIEWEVVSVPMRFAKENRRIIVKPVANMTYKTQREELPKLVAGVQKVLAKWPEENVLVHTVSYGLTKQLHDGLRGVEELGARKVMSYGSSADRDVVVETFRRGGGVLLAPSLERGVDLPDDLCRVVVVAKIPFPALGDRKVAERLRRDGGQQWYAVQVARSLVQMTGRGVRHGDDWCVTYILDRQFGSYWKDLGRKLLPAWWREAIGGGD